MFILGDVENVCVMKLGMGHYDLGLFCSFLSQVVYSHTVH